MCAVTSEDDSSSDTLANMTVEIVGTKAAVTYRGRSDGAPIEYTGPPLRVVENSPKAVVLLDRYEFPNEALKRLVPAVRLIVIDRKLGQFIWTVTVVGNPDNLESTPKQGVCIFK